VTEVRSLLGALRTGHRGDVDRVAPPASMIAPIQDEPDAWVAHGDVPTGLSCTRPPDVPRDPR
jgi:hypothetical protein